MKTTFARLAACLLLALGAASATPARADYLMGLASGVPGASGMGMLGALTHDALEDESPAPALAAPLAQPPLALAQPRPQPARSAEDARDARDAEVFWALVLMCSCVAALCALAAACVSAFVRSSKQDASR